MTIMEILDRLESLGFIDTNKKGFGGHYRVVHPKISKGSLYIGDQYISGTGKYAEIKNSIPQSSYDHKGYPEWRDRKTEALLDYLETWIE